jgi:hypothetical protein
MARRIYRIARSQGRWNVTRDGDLVATADLPEAAQEIAEQQARTDQPSLVVLHAEDGTVQRQWTHGDDADATPDSPGPEAFPGTITPSRSDF